MQYVVFHTEEGENNFLLQESDIKHIEKIRCDEYLVTIASQTEPVLVEKLEFCNSLEEAYVNLW